MNTGRTVFSQLLAHAPGKEFQKCVARYRGDANPRGFSCWDQYLAMAFAQLTYRESLRDIEASLRANIAETLLVPLITEQGGNGIQHEEHEDILSGPVGRVQ